MDRLAGSVEKIAELLSKMGAAKTEQPARPVGRPRKET